MLCKTSQSILSHDVLSRRIVFVNPYTLLPASEPERVLNAYADYTVGKLVASEQNRPTHGGETAPTSIESSQAKWR